MIVKDPRRLATPASIAPATRAEVREVLVELWASIFEAELRGHLETRRAAALSDEANRQSGDGDRPALEGPTRPPEIASGDR